MALRLIRRFDAWPSDIPMSCGTAIRAPQGVMRSISKSFRRLHLRSEAVKAFTALRKFITITVQRFLRRKRNQRALACQHKPLSDFTVAVVQALKWLTGAKQLKLL